jgi:AraC family transcriptional regulator
MQQRVEDVDFDHDDNGPAAEPVGEQESGWDLSRGRGHRFILDRTPNSAKNVKRRSEAADYSGWMKEDTEDSYRERILRVQLHIQNHLDEEMTLEELARVACFSPYHFHRIFRGIVGEAVKEHVRRLRLERAALRLRFTGQSVTDIAFQSGYETHESFTRAFEAMFGQPPSVFRKNHISSAAARGGRQEERRQTMDVEIRRLERMKVVFLRHVGPYDQVGAAWARLAQWAGPRGLFGPSTRMLGICYDDPEVTPPEKMRYDAAITVSEGTQGEGEVGVQEIGPGEYAVVRHIGPYQKLGETYARLCGEWLPQSGRELADSPPLEFYRNSPFATPPEQLITDIWMPLAPRG